MKISKFKPAFSTPFTNAYTGVSKVAFTASLHKWLSLLVGVQLLIWLATGLYFNLMDHEKASGNALREPVSVKRSFTDSELISLNKLNTVSEVAPQKVELIWVLGSPYYHVISRQGEHSYQLRHSLLFNAITGEKAALTPQQVLEIAKLSYSGSSELSNPKLLQPPFSDYVAQQNPMWKVSANDNNNTSIYIDSVTGQVLKHVNDDARLKALMFKLHFMDYTNTGGFNHWLIICFAFVTLFLSVTGVTLLAKRYQRRIFSVKRDGNKQAISVILSHSHTPTPALVESEANLFNALADVGIELPSVCNGAGTCGKCKFFSENRLRVAATERRLLSATELAEGVRLACQHKASEVTGVIDVSVTGFATKLQE
ncbi:PepSY domain-containing protein [Alteromonas hispanica]|uniref:2Fe-2S iron-sulfur cluster binding domain-containing protein n=1 Tax=Alteromonas hispanica TaxID=315421 RepID=A0A6L9MU16_9ALTE|nr:PepSY domain-containing protein [Alteromonas hispanica]NDW21688.1 2Fe-2S iron-sulfur cluster binding domain-containing protein [Alteromonas hispanica]